MNNEFEKKLFKKMLFNMSLSIFLIFSLYSVVLTTLYVKSQTDIAFMIPVFIDVIPLITDVCEIIGILIAYSYVIYVIKSHNKSYTRSFIISFALLTLYKYFAKFAVTYVLNGSIPTVKTLFEDIMWSFAVPILLEFVQFAIVVLASNKIIKNTILFIKEQKSLKDKLPNYEFDENKVFFPFTRIWNMKNPLQKSAFGCGMIVMISKIMQLLVIDFKVGLPTDFIDFLWMVIAYSLCVLLGFASYLFIIWTLMKLNTSEIKLKYN